AFDYRVATSYHGFASMTPALASATTFAIVDLVATTVSTSAIDLTWYVKVEGATAVQIERSTDETNFTTIATQSITEDPIYHDTGLDEDQTYAYRVKALYPFWTSNYSDGAAASTAPLQFLDSTPTTTSQTITWASFSSTAT